MPLVKHHWLQIHYARPDGKRAVEVSVFTGESLQGVLDAIATAQAGRLRYNPRAPRIVRIAAVIPPALDDRTKQFLDECLMLEAG